MSNKERDRVLKSDVRRWLVTRGVKTGEVLGILGIGV